MKKILYLLLFIILLTGCTKIDNNTYDELINDVLNDNIKLENQYRNGYKYYSPRGVNIQDKTDYNEKLKDQRNDYYLYIDLVSYINNKKANYVINNNIFYSNSIKYRDNEGYINITVSNNKYLIEMMYNYAKIEVIVDEDDIKHAINKSITILSSINYNKTLIEEIIKKDEYTLIEKELNIFETKDNNESNMLKYEEEYGTYEDEEYLPDPDIIN